MGKERRVGAGLLGTLIVSFIFLIGSVPMVIADESISISCYKGSDLIGNVVVYDVRSGPASCNRFYKDCEGRCSGCFYDFDYVKDVCIDWRGRTYLKY